MWFASTKHLCGPRVSLLSFLCHLQMLNKISIQSLPGTHIALEVASAGEHNLPLSFYSTRKTRKQFCVGTMQVQKTFEDAKEGLREARDCVALRNSIQRYLAWNFIEMKHAFEDHSSGRPYLKWSRIREVKAFHILLNYTSHPSLPWWHICGSAGSWYWAAFKEPKILHH